MNIAVAKKAKIVTGSDMPPFFAAEGEGQWRRPGEVDAGALRRQRDASAACGIATVSPRTATALDPEYIGGDLGKAHEGAGIGGDVGLATGYVLSFSNGLVVYLSGDTGITGRAGERACASYYHAKLVVMNIGDGFTTGPVEAAYVINELVKPAAVIASHANEVGTGGGKVRAGQQDRPVHQGGQGAGPRAALGQDDGVRRRRQVRRRLLKARF